VRPCRESPGYTYICELMGVLCCSACCRGDVGICQLLVNNGAPVTIDNMSGLSPLHVACLYGHSDCVAALLTVMCQQ